jgi:cytochrome c oxidase assembly factor CtaG
VSRGAAAPSPVRVALGSLAVALLAAALLPPLSGLARTHEVADAVQFAILALAIPALCVLGAPWGWGGRGGGLGTRLAAWRASRAGSAAGVPALVSEVAAVVAWRTTAGVGALERHHWLVLVEAATLLAAGVALWLELVASPPLAPRGGPLRRLVFATVAMWTVWIVAYVLGMAHGQGYPGFAHAPGHGLSAVADRQLATMVLFAAGACAFLPVVFWNLVEWLRAEERRGPEASRHGLRGGPRADGVRAAR